MCLYPRIIKNRKYTANKKNGGNVPAVNDERTKYVPIGCGNCIECRKQKARNWQVRLLEDLKEHKNGKFITLTFSNESIRILDKEIDIAPYAALEGYERDNEIATKAMRLFLERWRKEYGKSIRHWMVTELGHNGTENIHMHGIMWTDKPVTEIERIWQYGWIWKGKIVKGKLVNYVNAQTVNYIVKYINKIDNVHKTFKSKVLTSPGIGGNYLNGQDWKKNKFNEKKTLEIYRTSTGHKIAMPIYWRNKIYNEKEREQLWLQKLDKQERWICGEKIDISQGDEDYYKILEWHRKRNKELGYGDDVKNWSRTEYEKQRRIIMQKKRIQGTPRK